MGTRPSMFGPPAMFRTPGMFTGEAAQATGVESEWCLSFAGSGYASFTSQSLGTTHTIQCWVRHSGTSGVVVGGASGHRGLYVDATYLTYTAGGTSVSVAHGGISNTWKHVAVVRSGTSVSFYLDGSQVGSTQTLGANNSLSVQYVGRDATGAYLTGRVDDVRIHSTAIASGAVAATYANTSPASADVAYFAFEEGTGPTATDSAQSLSASLTSASWHPQTPPKLVSGRALAAKCVSLDGINDHVVLPDSTIWDIGAGSFTFAMWVKVNARDTGGTFLLHHQQGSGAGGFELWFDSTNVYVNVSDSANLLTAVCSVPLSQWKHVTALRRGTAVELYIDGSLVGSTTSSRSMNDVAGVVNIGKWSASSAYDLNGIVQDLRIYNAGLTAAQVAALARNQDVPTGLVARWKLDDGSGITADDSVGTADGTLVNGPTWSTDVSPYHV